MKNKKAPQRPPGKAGLRYAECCVCGRWWNVSKAKIDVEYNGFPTYVCPDCAKKKRSGDGEK
jgi:ribosome-binding protein aMBF1 (putative translation factor)